MKTHGGGVKRKLIKLQYQAKVCAAQAIMFLLIMAGCMLILIGLDRVIHGIEDLNRDMVELNQRVKVLTLNIKR